MADSFRALVDYVKTNWWVTIAFGGIFLVLGWKMNAALANIIVVLSWTIFLFAAFRAPLIDAQPALPRVLWTLLVGAVLGLIFYYTVWTGKTEDVTPFRISENGLTFINLTQNLSDTGSGVFWMAYTSGYGNTASPIALAQYVDISNLRSVPETIQSYSVAIKTEECGWIYLSPMYIRGQQIYFTAGGLAKAKLFDFSSNGLDYLLANPIQPHATVSGWWFFDSKVACNVPPGSNIQYRVSLKTFSGIEWEYVTPEIRIANNAGIPGKTEGQTRGPYFVVPPGKPEDDLTKYHKKLYSTPVT
jgi:hypothetical protein